MIKTERISDGCRCHAEGNTYDLIAECAAVVDTVTKTVQSSSKKPIEYETALQIVVGTVYSALHDGLGGEVLFHEQT